jgi:hypothetical protein
MVDAGARTVTLLGRRSILLLTLAALVAALLILFAAVLPAEYNRDPTGLGRLTGIGALWAPREVIVPATAGATPHSSTSYARPFRSDVVEVPLKASGDPGRGDEVEYKVHLMEGASYVYSWERTGIANPEEFYTEFHGHTLDQGKAITVAYYRKAASASDNGVLTAPFDGVHGWFFQNQSEKPVTVHLRIAGFYDLVPAGQPGNETGLQARRVP